MNTSTFLEQGVGYVLWDQAVGDCNVPCARKTYQDDSQIHLLLFLPLFSLVFTPTGTSFAVLSTCPVSVASAGALCTRRISVTSDALRTEHGTHIFQKTSDVSCRLTVVLHAGCHTMYRHKLSLSLKTGTQDHVEPILIGMMDTADRTAPTRFQIGLIDPLSTMQRNVGPVSCA